MENLSVLGVDLLAYTEKFDTALKLGPLRKAILHYKTTNDNIAESLSLKHSQPDSNLVNDIFRGINREDLIVTSLVQAEWIKTALTVKQFGIERSNKKIPNLRKVIDSWRQVCGLNIGCLFNSIPPEQVEETKLGLENLFNITPINPFFSRALSLYHLDRKIIEAHKQLSLDCQKWLKTPHPRPQIKMVHFKCPEYNMEIRMGWDIGVLIIDDKVFCLNRDLFLLWVNKLGELACAFLYVISQPQLFKDEGPEKLKELLLICSRVMLRKTKNGDWDDQFGFTLPKTLEAIGVGMIIAHEDKRRGWDNRGFLLNTIQGLIEDNVILGGRAEETDVFNFFDSLTTPEISELIGASKLLGHPDIDMTKGIIKLYTRTHEDIVIDQQTILETRGLLVFEFCQRFFKRTGTWPPIVIPPGQFPRLRGMVEIGTSPLSLDFTSNIVLTYAEWGTITIDPCLENDYWESPLEFIKDTALSPKRESVLAYCLKNKLHPEVELKTVLKTMGQRRDYCLKDSNRLVIQFLLSDDMYWQSLNYRKKWAESENMDDLEDEFSTYWVIKLTPKERELKIEGRFFGASPAPERDRRIQTEGVLASMMSKMYPEQMLTATELEFNQKLIKFRNYRRLYPNHHVLQLCFDFQAWNNYMRSAFIDAGISPVLDGIFNTHAYSRVMEFYERAIFHCETPESLTSWIGQLGGIEGLNQATWTLATLAGLKVALSNLGYKFEVSVKGDDCRAAVMIPKEDCHLRDLQQEADRIKAVLTQYCLNTGMHLKAEETFVSLSLIASSKQYQLDDVILPCGLKQALKMAHHSNAAFPTSQEVLADIMSSCHSACFQTPFIIQTWSIGVFVGLMRMNLDNKIFHHWSSSQISAFGVWPQVLGGPGILPLEIFIVRGENDLLSITLSLFIYIFNSSNDQALISALWNILCIPDKDDPHWKLLISDPYSLNKDHPITPGQFLKQSVRTQIKAITRNPMLKALMERDTLEGDTFLIDTLVTMNPAHVKIMTAIYENSAFAVLDKVLARVDNASSIFALLGAHKGIVRTGQGLRVLRKASQLHQRQVQWWMEIILLAKDHRYKGCYGSNFDQFKNRCPTMNAQICREGSWGIEIFGITYPAISQQFSLVPANYPVTTDFRINVRPQCAIYNFKGSTQVKAQTDHDHPFFSSPEEVNPWIGGKTTSKTKLAGYPQLHKSTALPRIEALLEIYSRAVPICRELSPLIKWLVRMMVYLSDDEFAILLPSVLGGCIAHRVEVTGYSATVTPNFRHNLLQLTTRNYDRMQMTHEQLNRDYTLNFAAINIHHSFLLSCTLLFSTGEFRPQRYYAVPHQANDERMPSVFDVCTHCIGDVTDKQLNIVVSNIPIVDVSESVFVVLPTSDVRALRMSLDLLTQQRQLNILATLNLNPRGTAQYLREANKAMINKMFMDAKRHIDELHVTVPGGLLSHASIEALGIKYMPFPIKFLTWMDPQQVAETVVEEVKLELRASYTKEQIMDHQVSTFRHSGLTSQLLPVIQLFTLASSHQSIASAFQIYQRRHDLKEPMTGIDIRDPAAFTNWIYRIGLKSLQKPQQAHGHKTHHYQIVTTHNETQALILQNITPKLQNITMSARRHQWQTFYLARGNVMKNLHAESPCDLWCQGNGDLLNWIHERVVDPENGNMKKWLYRVMLLPISIETTIQTPAELLQGYHSRVPIPALRLAHPNPEIYRENDESFSSLSSFFGFNFSWYITGQCQHGTYNLDNDFMPMVGAMIHMWNLNVNQNPFRQWRATWAQRIRTFADLEIIHMEEEAAMREVTEHPFRVGTMAAETQRRMQNPGDLPILHGMRLRLNQRNLPDSIGAADLDVLNIMDLVLPDNPIYRHQWVNWNQHLRIRGFSGSACCKLWEILYTHHALGRPGEYGVSLHLADGQGGFATMIGRTFEQFMVFFNTLQHQNNLAGGYPGDWIANIPTTEQLICDMTESGDLCDDDEVRNIIAIVEHTMVDQPLTLITFDAERYDDRDVQDNLKMLSNVATICGRLSGPDTVIVIRLFWVEWMLTSCLFGYLIDSCRKFKLVKPNSSRETNLEFYILIQGINYPFSQFVGRVHQRRMARLRTALRNLVGQFHTQPQFRIIEIERIMPGMLFNQSMPTLSSKQVEMILRLPVGILSHKTHWEMNSIHHRMDEQIDKSKRNLVGGRIHSVSRGRRAVSTGGVRLVQEATSQILRLSGALEVFKLNGGWMREETPEFSHWLREVHSDYWQGIINNQYRDLMMFVTNSDLWNICPSHDSCATSEGSNPIWAHLPIHLDLEHEYGMGVDVAVRLITLGFIAESENRTDEIINGILRS